MEDSGIILIDSSLWREWENKKIPNQQLAKLAKTLFHEDESTIDIEGYESHIWHTDGFLELRYSGSVWRKYCEQVFESTSIIDFCSCYSDDYGSMDLISISEDNKRQRLIFDQSGDDMEVESYRKEFEQKYNRWKSIIPECMVKHIPNIYFNDPKYFY